MKLTARCWSIFDFILDLFSAIAMVLLVFMMLSVCFEVVSRYFFGRGIIWVIEFSEYILLYITFLGTTWVLKNEGHIEMDVVISLLNQKTQLIFSVVTSIVGALVCIVIAWIGAVVALDHLRRGLHQPTLVQFPDFPLFAVIPVGSFLLFVQFLRRAYGFLKDKEKIRK